MFTTMLQKNSVECWRFDLAFGQENIDTIDQNDETLYYPVDIIVSLSLRQMNYAIVIFLILDW